MNKDVMQFLREFLGLNERTPFSKASVTNSQQCRVIENTKKQQGGNKFFLVEMIRWCWFRPATCHVAKRQKDLTKTLCKAGQADQMSRKATKKSRAFLKWIKNFPNHGSDQLDQKKMQKINWQLTLCFSLLLWIRHELIIGTNVQDVHQHLRHWKRICTIKNNYIRWNASLIAQMEVLFPTLLEKLFWWFQWSRGT